MKGYIKIESAVHEGKEGLTIQTDLSDVRYVDVVTVVDSVCNALNITPTMLKRIADLIDSGFMEKLTDTVVLEDSTDMSCKTKSDKKSTGGDFEDMINLLINLMR